MTAGIALLSQIAPGVPLAAVALFVVVAGFGMGILFTATAVVVQTVLPSTQLGAGFGVVRYVGQIGGVLGLALVGTVVNVSLAGELHRQLPTGVIRRLAVDGIRFTARPQSLVSPTFRRAAMQRVTREAESHVSPGPHNAGRVAAATRKDMVLLRQAFAALRLSLALAVRYGLLAALFFCGGALLAALAMLRSPSRR